MTLDGRRPWMEDNLVWKTTMDVRRLLIEDDLGWKTTFQQVNMCDMKIEISDWLRRELSCRFLKSHSMLSHSENPRRRRHKKEYAPYI